MSAMSVISVISVIYVTCFDEDEADDSPSPRARLFPLRPLDAGAVFPVCPVALADEDTAVKVSAEAEAEAAITAPFSSASSPVRAVATDDTGWAANVGLWGDGGVIQSLNV